MRQINSKYFSLADFEHSQTANLKNIDNTIPEELIANIQDLVDNVLDPARMRYNKPIYVNSGYRSDAVNKAVGGVPTSQHREGKAADIRSEDIIELFRTIRDNIEFDQLILYPTFVHVSYNKGKNRKHFFTK
jgi:uncharacterized protein YcbK (DUF882 family)